MMDYIGTSVPRFYNLKAVHEVILQFEAADRARAVSANWKSSQSTVSSVLAPTSAPINVFFCICVYFNLDGRWG